MSELLGNILSNAVNVSILAIIFTSVVGFYVRARAQDRCIADLDGFLVTVERDDGEIIWGTAKIYGTGIELIYPQSHRDTQGHVENSYILYNNELESVQAFYRLHDDQSRKKQQLRARDIQCTYRPSIFRTTARALRNMLSTFKDALVQALNAVLSARAAQKPQNAVLSKHKELTAGGAQLLGALRKTYDPILEHYIGQYVVLEILRGDRIEEEYGILKEYTARFIELLNVKIQVPTHLYLKNRQDLGPSSIQIQQLEGVVRVTNHLARTIVIDAIKCAENSRDIDLSIDSLQTCDIPLEKAESGAKIELETSVRCLTDLIVPHARAVVRHAGKREKLSVETLLGLDDLYEYPWVKRLLN